MPPKHCRYPLECNETELCKACRDAQQKSKNCPALVTAGPIPEASPDRREVDERRSLIQIVDRK